jgi:S-adenosylmethionine decarboxylase
MATTLTSKDSTPAATSSGWPTANAISGLHLIAELTDCPETPLFTDSAQLEAACVDLVRQVGLIDVGCHFHAFGEGEGVTGTVVLAESHLCIHTWPEHRFVTLDVYVCNYSGDNSTKARTLTNQLIKLFQPGKQRVREMRR